MKKGSALILGAGMTGLAAGWVSGLPVYESENVPGGICSSYYIDPGKGKPLYTPPEDGESYRFEIGGGHWIFGGDPSVLGFIRSLTPVNSYSRRSAVFFSKSGLYVPYPIQNHLCYLGKETAKKALDEITTAPKGKAKTMSDWLEENFGQTLTRLFFAPFHERYTAGLWTRIAPQDAYKSPVNPSLVLRGASDKTPPVGYNVTFVYPEEGLNTLAERMARRCRVDYGKRVTRIDVHRKEVLFADGSGTRYERVISTLPLNRVMEMTGLEVDEEPDCCTSVLVLNIGAKRGENCPDEHWLYIPDSDSGFHRVGFYSNVDSSFLPRSSRGSNDRVSIYVERAYREGEKPSDDEIKTYSDGVVRELRLWGFIGDVETIDPTWIEVAYTWSWPGSNWRKKALKSLEGFGIFQVGRYGRWIFQGIAESIGDGFSVGRTIGGT
ncbi:MAG TPA: FAD-dependent oxidoreductase [Thermodesulfobacteriota bacterium]|jgi:protoporphyrinogen oxidase|nr:FAD-dependent oxidoreductase [Thermodesulfobacteriota bacterium]